MRWSKGGGVQMNRWNVEWSGEVGWTDMAARLALDGAPAGRKTGVGREGNEYSIDQCGAQ